MARLRTGVAGGVALLAGCACLGGGKATVGIPVNVPPAVAIMSASAAPPLRFASPTAGELARSPVDSDPDDALSLRVRFVALPDVSAELVSRPLDEDAQAIVDPRTGELELAPTLASGARSLDGVTAEQLLAQPRASLATDLLVALPRGATVEVSLRTERAAPPTPVGPGADVAPAPRGREQVSVLVSRRRLSPGTCPDAHPEEIEVALDLESVAPPPPPDEPSPEDVPGRPARGERRRVRSLVHNARARPTGSRELLALVPRLVSVPAHLAWGVPAPYSHDGDRLGIWVAVAVDVRRAPYPSEPGFAAHRRAHAATVASLGGERERIAREAPVPALSLVRHSVDRSPVSLEPLFESLAQDALPRPALVALGKHLGAGLVVDAALALPDSLVPRLARKVLLARARRDRLRSAAAALGGSPGAAFPRTRSLGLDLDLAALETLVAPDARDPGRVLLERRFGVAIDDDPVDPRRPFLAIAAAIQEPFGLEGLVLARNLAALDDPRPGVRVRAARWLKASRGDLMGYDPFAPLEERRAAIDRLWAATRARRAT